MVLNTCHTHTGHVRAWICLKVPPFLMQLETGGGGREEEEIGGVKAGLVG